MSADRLRRAGFYWLAALGPGVPHVEIVSVDDPTWSNVLESNAALEDKLAKSRVPTVVTQELQVGNLSECLKSASRS